MNWKKRVFESFKLYAITDLNSSGQGELKKVKEAYRGGADIIQLRSKALSDRDLLVLGFKMKELANRYRKLFFVNDRLDLALALGADGLHLGQDDMPLDEARRLCRKTGTHLWIGKSTHSIAQAVRAVKEGADYIGVGPVFQTPTKPGYRPVGLELVRKVREIINIPFVAIGGIQQNNINEVLESGATRIAVVRAVFHARNTYVATKKLRHQIEKRS
ncbi:MAG TPA: thiamine phosphate synthase [bacterium]|nr:thiamine phosphate synthase [bacterium]